jgi:alpha-amylase
MPRRCATLSAACLLSLAAAAQPKPSPWEHEIFYQIFPISFRDSNRDGIGDFKGIESKLGFLKNLGVTAILINPIFKSRFYHRYFADDFMNTDPAFGTNEQFFHLVRTAHRLHMKIVLDMEIQYVADKHPWYVAAKANPSSAQAKFLWKSKSLYTQGPLEGYDGQKIRASAIDPANPEVLQAIERVFEYWTAPNGDRNSGVDGFRIDHMMDDFDGLHVKKQMLLTFWAPIIRDVRHIKPRAFFVGEQADWGYGSDLYNKAGVDAVFAFQLWYAFTKSGHPNLAAVLTRTAKTPPPDKTQLIFIENHDVERYASMVAGNPSALRLGAVLNLVFKGTPVIYQGQELGMKGIPQRGRTDANDIPDRLGYRWNKSVDAPGTPSWYRGHVPQGVLSFSRSGDGISVEEEEREPYSLLNFYRALIRLRQTHPVLQTGSQIQIPSDNPRIVAFERRLPGKPTILVFLNVSGQVAEANIPRLDVLRTSRTTLLGKGTILTAPDRERVHLRPYGFWILAAP